MKRFNINEFIWFIILGFNLIFLSYMLWSKKIFLIINSDMKIYMYIAIIIIGLMLIIQFNKIFTIPSRSGIKLGNLVFVISAVLLLMLTKIDIVKTSLEFKDVKLYHGFHSKNSHEHSHQMNCINNEKIILDDGNFHEMLEEVLSHIDEYIGKDIEIQGIAYNDKKYEGKFIITSLEINCCIVDSTYLGVLCKENNFTLENGQKIRVTGKIDKTKIRDNMNNDIWVPLIEVSNLIEVK